MTESNGAAGPSAGRESWLVVFAGFTCIVFMFGVPTMVMPVIYSPIIDEYGWGRAEVTAVATLKFGAGAVCGIFFGALLDRFSIRLIVSVAGVVSGLAMIGFLLIRSLWQFYAVGLVMGLGAIAVMIAIKVLVSREFLRRQGFAIGFAMLGTSVAGTFTPVLTSYLVDLVGWRMAVAVLSSGIWLIALPAFLLLVREGEDAEPAPVVAAPAVSGGTPAMPLPVAGPGTPGPPEAADFGEVLKRRSFWFLAAAVILIGFVDQALAQHTVLYLDRDVGLGRSVAAQALGLIFFVSIFGKVGFGWLYDRLSVRGVMLCYFLIAASVLLAFPVEVPLLLLTFSVVRGVSHGGAIVDIPVLAKHCFGPRVLGRAIGVLTACVTIGFAIGPPAVGYLYDLNGNYRIAFFVMMGVAMAAGTLLLAVQPTYWRAVTLGEARAEGGDALPSRAPATSRAQAPSPVQGARATTRSWPGRRSAPAQADR